MYSYVTWLVTMVSGPNVIPSFAIIAAFTAAGEPYALQSIAAQAVAECSS